MDDLPLPSAPSAAGGKREIGDEAVWSLSSCKQGFGVDQLRDGSLNTYWQSDGPQPHLVNIQFHRKTAVQELAIYADYKQDESYTPNRISVRIGTSFHDLVEIQQVELNEPEGWLQVPLKNPRGAGPVRTFLIQLAVLSNHQNGRDTHMRLIDVYAPLSPSLPYHTPFHDPELLPLCSLR